MVGPSLAQGGVLHTFGSGHSEVISREIIGRAGGLMCITGMYDPTGGFIENLVGYGTKLAERYDRQYGLLAGEAIIVISNSGKNSSPIEVALHAKSKGVTVIGLTCVAMSRTAATVHPSGKKLHEVADYVLDNGEIAIVINADGAVVDAGDARVGKDELGRFSPCLGAPIGCATNAAIEAGHDGDGTAWVVARGKAQGDERVRIATRYALSPGARVVLVLTVVTSQADAPIELPRIGDDVVWGSAEEQIPGAEPNGAPFVAAIAPSAARVTTATASTARRTA